MRHTRSCSNCVAHKKQCDLEIPCARCARRGFSAEECVEPSMPSERRRTTGKRDRSAEPSPSPPARKKAKQEDEVGDDGGVGTEEVEKDGEDGDGGTEGGEEEEAGDDQPSDDELIWREGDGAHMGTVTNDTTVLEDWDDGDDEESDEQVSEGEAADEQDLGEGEASAGAGKGNETTPHLVGNPPEPDYPEPSGPALGPEGKIAWQKAKDEDWEEMRKKAAK